MNHIFYTFGHAHLCLAVCAKQFNALVHASLGQWGFIMSFIQRVYSIYLIIMLYYT